MAGKLTEFKMSGNCEISCFKRIIVGLPYIAVMIDFILDFGPGRILLPTIISYKMFQWFSTNIWLNNPRITISSQVLSHVVDNLCGYLYTRNLITKLESIETTSIFGAFGSWKFLENLIK